MTWILYADHQVDPLGRSLTNVNLVATITDATLVANTSDVLNVAITANGIDGTADNQGTITAAGVETINISVTDGVIQTPTNLAADAQQLALVATKAKTIVVTGDTALTLTTFANTAVTLIDGSAMTGALTVTAAGTVASTLKGGSAGDTLTASTSAIAGVNNATAASAVIAQATPGKDAVKQVSTVTLGSFDAGDTIKIDGIGGTSAAVTAAVDITTTVDLLVAEILARTGETVVATNVAGVLTLTAITAGTAFTATATVVDAGTATLTTATVATPTANVVAVSEVETVTLTDGTNTGLTIGDKMSLTVDVDGAGAGAATTFTYTATAATETMATAATALAALIDADAGVSASFAGGVITITDSTADLAGITVSAYTITDAASTGINGDVLIGGAGNDTLVAGSLSTLTGGAGFDTFDMNTQLSNVNSYSTITDIASGDKVDTASTVFKAAAVTLASTAVFQDYANEAIKVTANTDVSWFQFGGDTYVVQNDSGSTSFVNGTDDIIKITGAVDLSLASFNTSLGTIEFA